MLCLPRSMAQSFTVEVRGQAPTHWFGCELCSPRVRGRFGRPCPVPAQRQGPEAVRFVLPHPRGRGFQAKIFLAVWLPVS